MRFRSEIGESLTLKFAESASERRKSGKEILSLGLGEPDFEVPEDIINAVSNVLHKKKSGYSSPMGLPGLKDKLAKKLSSENGIPAKPNNILVTAGAKQAFQLALMALLDPDDEVIIINPSYVSFIPQVYIAEPSAKVRLVDVDKDDFSIPKDKLRSCISERTKVLVINTPNNPAGYTIPNDELDYLYQLAEENDFYIISDEVYEKLVFPDVEHNSIGAKENKVERIFTVNGYSKSHAMTGWRLGYLCFPDSFFTVLLKLQQHINTNTCTFIQQAVLDVFDLDMSFLFHYREKLERRAKIVSNYIDKTDRMSCVTPRAGFFSFINISPMGVNSNTFCSKLIEETGVATTPGIAFGNNWDDHFRLSFAVSEDVLEDGLQRIINFTNDL